MGILEGWLFGVGQGGPRNASSKPTRYISRSTTATREDAPPYLPRVSGPTTGTAPICCATC